MKTRDFVKICKKMAKICRIMSDSSINWGSIYQLEFYALDFENLGKIYTKLNRRKKFKKLMEK